MAAKFEKFLILPDFPIKFRKSHQISKNYLKRSESYGQKPLGGPERPPSGLNRVKLNPDSMRRISFPLFKCLHVPHRFCLHLVALFTGLCSSS